MAFAGACVLASSISCPPAWAHRLESAMSTIESNARTGKIEIIHEINYHDLEHVMNLAASDSVDLVTPPSGGGSEPKTLRVMQKHLSGIGRDGNGPKLPRRASP